MRHLFTAILTLALTCNLQAQGGVKKTCFGIGLFTSAHSQLITYAIITLRDSTITGALIVTEQQFMYQAMGYYPSLANMKRENLFQKYGVDSCFLVSDELDNIIGYYAKPFYDLWKIRFYEHPMYFDTEGWSQGQMKPSRYQSDFLYKEYGVSNVLTQYFYGDTLFKLLRDVQDPAWIESYRFAAPVDSTASSDTTAGAINTGQP
ncbi:MAG: hypothetical protein IPO32_07035 [Crocinitomicaceae bacterium]|nr:hypothetical protein [Crocinitomicaceae bacterium]